MTRTLNELLDVWSVLEPGAWENDLSEGSLVSTWYAVANDDGIVAYFGSESDALRFRLAEINRELNG